MQTEKEKKQTVRKLSHVILEYLFLSIVVAGFTFLFLYTTCESIGDSYLLRQEIVLTEMQDITFRLWLRSICAIASILIFIVLFLFMLGQRLSYLLTITKGIEKLHENRMDYNIPLDGNDELTLLADSINYLAASQRELHRDEETLKSEREAWIRSLSHDIRTPLTSMLSYSEYLLDKDTLDSEHIRAYIELVYAKCQQIRTLASQLTQRRTESREYVEDLHFLFEQLSQEWAEILEDHFSCSVDLTRLSRFDGYADIYSLRRIIDNLASNTEKYASYDSPVTLTVESSERRLLLIQKNKTRSEGDYAAPPESHKIGVDNIRQIAALYEGSVDIFDSDDTFEIRISLYIPTCLQNSSESST
nr:histidine kinase dimerization/phospho-acceptor domain-containing protein [uncultured Mediterraneibacter sp.]